MAFAAGSTVYTDKGFKYIQKIGTYTQASGDTGGNISTGLKTIVAFFATGALGWSNSSGTVTLLTSNPGATVTGSWMAIGYES